MPELYKPAAHWHGNLLCAVDLETSGVEVDEFEIVQIAVVPLNFDYTPLKTIRPFNSYIRPTKPMDPESIKVHGLTEEALSMAASAETVIDRLLDWVNSIGLVFDRRLVMLAHNASFETKWLHKLLTIKLHEKIFNPTTRDSMALALAINDMAMAQGRTPPYERVSMKWLCEHFGIVNHKAHDALYDSYACAEVYRRLLGVDVIL